MEERDRRATADSSDRADEDRLVAEDEPSEDRSDLPSASVGPAEAEVDTPLLPAEQSSEFEQRWQRVQAGFVDEPRQAVEEADKLVADLIDRLAESFSQSRSRLETQWDQGNDASTEELRIALMRYRSFFKRLLSA
jgi:hypothetical protein